MKKIIIKGIPYGIITILLIVASFYDYRINVQMANRLAGFDIFIERFAILPLIILIIACFYLYFIRTKNYLFLLFAFIACIYAGFDTMGYWFNGIHMYIASFGLALGLGVSIYLIVAHIPATKQQQVAYWLMYFTMVLLISMLVTTILKNIWGRVRFRDGNGIESFTPWYLPQGYNGNRSFPSGHTTAWTSILCFLHVYPQRKASWYTIMIIIGLLILMPLTRMSCGAHYLSDTLVGFGITYSIYLWITSIYQKRRLI